MQQAPAQLRRQIPPPNSPDVADLPAHMAAKVVAPPRRRKSGN